MRRSVAIEHPCESKAAKALFVSKGVHSGRLTALCFSAVARNERLGIKMYKAHDFSPKIHLARLPCGGVAKAFLSA